MKSAYDDLILKLAVADTTDDAVEALAAEGDAALEALASTMLDESQANRVREICSQLLGQIVPRGIEHLLHMLEYAEGNKADLAAWGLRWAHDGAKTENLLFKWLSHKSSRVRANAARALKYIHVDLTRCDPSLIAAISDSCISVRLDALRTIGQLAELDLASYGITDEQTLRSAALDAASDDDDQVREAARELLVHLDNKGGVNS